MRKDELERKIDKVRNRVYVARAELFNAEKVLVKAAEKGDSVTLKAQDVKKAYDELVRLENILSDLREKLACKK